MCCLETNVLSTFNVIGVSVNTSGLVCVFNPGSHARGCLVYLTDAATGVTYCIAVGRSLDTPVNTSLCPSTSSNGPLSAGEYLAKVYDIESDGSVSKLPAITENVECGPSVVLQGLIYIYYYFYVHIYVSVCITLATLLTIAGSLGSTDSLSQGMLFQNDLQGYCASQEKLTLI